MVSVAASMLASNSCAGTDGAVARHADVLVALQPLTLTTPRTFVPAALTRYAVSVCGTSVTELGNALNALPSSEPARSLGGSCAQVDVATPLHVSVLISDSASSF